LIVRTPKAGAAGAKSCIRFSFGLLRDVFASATVSITYLASGLQLFVMGAIMAWMPSLLNRAYGMAPDRAAALGGGFILISGVGMIVCGVLTDRLTRNAPRRKLAMAAAYCAITFVLLTAAFLLPAGPTQLALACVGVFFAAGSTGPSGAVVADGTNPALHATVLATLTLANNLIGLAPGPIVTGVVADHSSLADAFKVIPSLGLIACAAFLLARRAHRAKPGA
jgi:MFS family permease